MNAHIKSIDFHTVCKRFCCTPFSFERTITKIRKDSKSATEITRRILLLPLKWATQLLCKSLCKWSDAKPRTKTKIMNKHILRYILPKYWGVIRHERSQVQTQVYILWFATSPKWKSWGCLHNTCWEFWKWSVSWQEDGEQVRLTKRKISLPQDMWWRDTLQDNWRENSWQDMSTRTR